MDLVMCGLHVASIITCYDNVYLALTYSASLILTQGNLAIEP